MSAGPAPQAAAGPAAGRILIAGLGSSGRAMAQALRSTGFGLRGIDDREDVDRRGLPADLVLGPLDDQRITAALEGVVRVVTSPGLAPTHPVLTAAAARRIPIWSEPELAWQLNAGRTALVAVTGTNGKTTTTEMLAACLGAPAAGNIGLPLVTALTLDPPPLAVAELSSFQLHFTDQLRPRVSVLVNVADDHLDWHGGAQGYAADKARIWAAQTADDVVVALTDDEGVRRTLDTHPPAARVVGVSTASGHVDLGDDVTLDLAALTAPGPHNAANAALAAVAAVSAGADPRTVVQTLLAFRPGGHRLELVATIDGVAWVDDSKATNPHAALAALRSYPDVIWIAGGLNKGLAFDALAGEVAARVRHVLTIGTSGPEVAEMARGAGVPVTECGELTVAVATARGLADAGMTVLLAPAAASMDQFTNYAERGDVFAALVRDLPEHAAAGVGIDPAVTPRAADPRAATPPSDSRSPHSTPTGSKGQP